jgi:4-hydroxy-2-oxoheptanedioate aldolase
MKNLINKLKDLAENYGVIGIKQSFEDEGVSLDDLTTIRRLTDLAGIKSFVKIGGCEAKSDIANCIKIGVDCVIAPMVESKFAVSKFVNMIKPHNDILDSYIVIETIQAKLHLDEILQNYKKHLSGVVIGRSDFTKSLGFEKDKADSDELYEMLEQMLQICNNHELPVTMGGSISVKSVNFIKKMYEKKLLHKIETRNVVIKLDENSISKLDKCIQHALAFEIEWLKYKQKISNFLSEDYKHRIYLLENRL